MRILKKAFGFHTAGKNSNIKNSNSHIISNIKDII